MFEVHALAVIGEYNLSAAFSKTALVTQLIVVGFFLMTLNWSQNAQPLQFYWKSKVKSFIFAEAQNRDNGEKGDNDPTHCQLKKIVNQRKEVDFF